MAGNGKRTAALGKFKPFIKVKNKKIIEWFLISIKNKIKNKDTIILITTKDFEKKFNFEKNMKIIIKKYKLNIKNLIFKFIDATPKGPAYTVYSIKNILIYLNKPCIVVNPDQYIDFDLPKSKREEDGKKLALFNAAGHLELAVYKSNPLTVGSAGSLFGLGYRDLVTVQFD